MSASPPERMPDPTPQPLPASPALTVERVAALPSLIGTAPAAAAWSPDSSTGGTPSVPVASDRV